VGLGASLNPVERRIYHVLEGNQVLIPPELRAHFLIQVARLLPFGLFPVKIAFETMNIWT
jgi:hypothetical protein